MGLNDFQRQVTAYDRKSGWTDDQGSHIVLHMTEELGEVARHIVRHEGYKKGGFEKKELAQELTDVLYLTFKLANRFDIKLDEEWELMWKRFKGKVSRSNDGEL
jgi:NTP pyrophosphatase (non-canonical NTP hydrolase)